METMVEQMGWIWPLLLSAGKALAVLVLGWVAAGAISGMVRRRVLA